MNPSPQPALYDLQAVGKVYSPRTMIRGQAAQPVVALSGITLQVLRGEFLCVVGASGDGKTTLLNLLGALETPTSGTLLFEGRSLSDYGLVKFRRERVGFVHQVFHLLPHFTALENVALGLTMQGVPARRAKGEARDWLERLGVGERAASYPPTLSGGEKQRVGIARAMVKHPDVLLADEPTGSLDRDNRQGVLETIANMRREYDTTVILVTHALAEVLPLADRVFHLDSEATPPSLPN